MEQRLVNAFNKFTKEMYEKLQEKEDEGFSGWNIINKETLQYNLMHHVNRLITLHDTEEIDIANLAMFLWYKREINANRRNKKNG